VHADQKQTTTLNRQWLVKMFIFMIVLIGFGCWGLLDAMVIYPARGHEDAGFKQKLYLEAAQAAGRLSDASIPDPRARLGVLAARRDALEAAVGKAASLQAQAAGDSSQAQQAAAELRRLQPDLVGALDPARTTMAAPADDLKRLSDRWKTAVQPKPLAAYDLPLQWAFAAIGLIGGVYILLLVIVPASRTVFTWEPGPQRLTLPGGRSITPTDIIEFDKRKWDKFFVTLTLRDGSHVKLDLLKHARLEEWVLEMERSATPGEAAPAAAAAM
jgi:hypothetical protein